MILSVTGSKSKSKHDQSRLEKDITIALRKNIDYDWKRSHQVSTIFSLSVFFIPTHLKATFIHKYLHFAVSVAF